MNNIYDKFMAPLEERWLARYRRLLMPYAKGRVLEVGFGTGVNLKYYDFSAVESLTALDMKTEKEIEPAEKHPVRFVKGEAEVLPFEDSSFDSVVETLVLCSVKDIEKSVSEFLRVLKPGGTLIFIDHVLPARPLMAKVFKGVDVIWTKITKSCSLIKEPHLIIEKKIISGL